MSNTCHLDLGPRRALCWLAGSVLVQGPRSFVSDLVPNHPPSPRASPPFPPATLFSFQMSRSNSSDFDPLSFALQPPPGETDEQRMMRLQREAEEKIISDSIDEELRIERENQKRKRGGQSDVKLLLLGLFCELFLEENVLINGGKQAKPRAVNQHCKSSFNSCMRHGRWKTSEQRGSRLCI